MFTGIIETQGIITKITDLGGGKRWEIQCGFAAELKVDESVAHNGACLTVVAQNDSHYEVEIIEETLRKTSLGQLSVGDSVNLERALRYNGRLDGHFVQGHVDGVGNIIQIEKEATSTLYTVEFPVEKRKFLIPVGSITIDGISLTVARLTENSFTVALIPHTLQKTTAGNWFVGQTVNLEFDMLGKYVVGALELKKTEM
jgi:riboflavin synthase